MNHDSKGSAPTDGSSSSQDDPSNTITSKEKKSKVWRIMTFEVLTDLVAEAKGEATRKVIEYIKTHLGNTKLVFVVGQSGTGKSSLLKELTGIDLKVGHGAKSVRLQHHVCPAIIDDQQYLFIDTAGFGAADADDTATFIDIVGCLNGLGPFVDIAGLLFVYGGTQNRPNTNDLQTLQWIQCFCGPEFYRNIVWVTTKWDGLNSKGHMERWALLEDVFRQPEVTAILDPTTRHIGATTYHHGLRGGIGGPDAHENVLDNAKDVEMRSTELRSMVKRTFSHAPIVKLQIAQEMGPKGDWTKTEAAKVLASDPQSIVVEVHGNRALVCAKTAAGISQTSNEVPKGLPPPHAAHPGIEPTSSTGGDKQKSQGKQKSWYQSAFEWLELARRAADFFLEIQKAPIAARGSWGRRFSNTWSSMWEGTRNWWSGTPEK